MVARSSALELVRRQALAGPLTMPGHRQSMQTCAEASAAGAADAAVDEAAAASLAAALPPQDVIAAAQYLRLPIRFDSQEAEVTALALLHLLDFGSGWDELLVAKAGRGASELAQFGVLGLLLQGSKLDAGHLATFSRRGARRARRPSAGHARGGARRYQVAAHWNVDTSEETGVEGLPGVTMVKQGPLGAYVAAVQRVLNDAGRALRESGQPTLGALILKRLGDQAAEGGAPSAAALVEELAEAVPGFRLHLRFRGSDPRFAFADAGQLTVDSGERREQGGDARKVALRAATVAGGQAVVDAAGGAFQAFHLSAYLAQQAERAAAAATASGDAGGDAGAQGQQEAALAKGFVDRGTTAEVQSHPVEAEEQPKGVLGTIKEKLGFGGSAAESKTEESRTTEERVKERVEAPGTPAAECAPSKARRRETTEQWRTAQAEAVRAEQEAKRAEALACEVGVKGEQAAAASGLSSEAERRKQELEQEQRRQAEAAEAKQREAADLDRQLAAARQAAAVAERRRAEVLEETKRMEAPSKELQAEADRRAWGAWGAGDKAASRGVKAEEEDSRRKQAEAERLAQVAREKTAEADDLARKYWAVGAGRTKRDEAKAAEQAARDAANAATAEARDAQKKRVTVERMEKRAEKAEEEAAAARQKKAELERQAQQLAGEMESAEQRARRLEAEAEERRRAAGERLEEVHRRREKVETEVRAEAPPTGELEAKAAEARRAAEAAQAREGAVAVERERLEKVAQAARTEAGAKAEELRDTKEAAQAAQAAQQEAWERAKAAGEAAKERTAEETGRRMEKVEESQVARGPATPATTTATREERTREERTSATTTATGSAPADPSAAYGVHSGKSTADIFHAGGDVGEAPTKAEAQGHETMEHARARTKQAPGKTDAELLREEGADLPHATRAGHVQMPGAGEK
eukprot:scaffold17.g438.t1